MKTKRLRALICAVLAAMMTLPALSCAKEEAEPVPAGQAEMPAAEEQKTDDEENPAEEAQDAPADAETEPETARDTDLHDERVTPPESGMLEVEKNMFLAKVGDCGFSAFLAGGGASSDADVVAFLTAHLSVPGLDFAQIGAGCSTVAAQSADGGHVFGRNFDWSSAQVLILETHPSDGYASFSTVNLDFLRESARLPDEAIPMAAYYAPLDGMNEKGVGAGILQISIDETHQDNGKPDLLIYCAIRAILDNCASVDEALKLLDTYDIHSDLETTYHLFITDRSGRYVVVEWLDGKMVTVEHPCCTNSVIAPGKYYGKGETDGRLSTIEKELGSKREVTEQEAMAILEKVKNKQLTEWSCVYNLDELTVSICLDNDFSKVYTFKMKELG